MHRDALYGRTGASDLYSKMSRSGMQDLRGGDDLDEFTDDEATPLTEPIYNGSQRSYMETKGWDVFRVLPPEQDSGSEALNQKCFNITIKVLKVITYILTFSVVLCGCVISKGVTLFMTSQIKPGKGLKYCNRELERDKEYMSEISLLERVAWTWCIFLAFVVPELGTMFRSVRICVFKSSRRCSFSDFMIIWIFESMHVAGLALFVFVVLPDLDVVKGAMITNCVAFIPSVLGLASRYSKESRRFLKVVMDFIAIGAQATGFFIWPLVEVSRGNTQAWTVPVSIFLISAGWWENYVDRRSPLGPVKELGRIKDRLKKNRYFTYSFISCWKIIFFFACMMLFLQLSGTNPTPLITHVYDAFQPHPINITQVHRNLVGGATLPDIPGAQLLDEIIETRADGKTPLIVLLIQIFASYFAYIFGKFACKICIQGFSFAFPVNLTVPVTISLLISACGIRNDDPCWFKGHIPEYLYFECPQGDFLNDFISNQHAWIWLIWLLSQTWITVHIWIPHCERLAPTEKIFVTPMYCSFLTDQSLCLNRRRDDEGEVKTEELELDRVGMEDNDISQYYETISIHTEGSNSNTTKTKTSDSITRIYACATMWHETKSEMMQMMKSLFRMDEDQSARRVAQKYLKVVDTDYYEFETHIFFDDAFEISDVCDDWMQVNQFVRMFVECVDEAGSYVHQTNIRLRPPKKIPTPYGGRLVYTLPGKTKMIVHMKDKMKIRHKKRWSQCMYMYYLLGHRLMELPISVDRKEILAENTYILTLDGDIDFQPPAVTLLVDLMKKNRNLGAACGRIHPVGSGPMAWYQIFEYAIGHWLQKATEHMIGCVMCSPGCFSLFRGKALMDDNVMRRYTTKSEEPRHYVQYDQGEDRWLCTLLLQRGYRVEYSAASDAYTHCPEGFNEFFNQRRRWVPSTIANIFDLLLDYKATVKINDNISLPYIWYQVMLMSGTIIGPGTIFLMLVGAFVAAFRISNWISFYYNLIPIVVYTVVCLTCKSKWQLALSGILSTFYALVMMAVIVGTALQLGEDGVGSPSAMFLISMCSSFLIAAFLHPQEFWCIVPGLIYLLCIPSMYLLLIIYSITNLNVVSWGTREVQAKKTKKELEAEKKMASVQQTKARKEGLWGMLINGNDGNQEEEGGIDFSIGNVLRLMMFTHKKDTQEREQLVRIADSLDVLNKRLDNIEGNMTESHGGHKGERRRKSSRLSGRGGTNSETLTGMSDNGDAVDLESQEDESRLSEPSEERDDLINPYWVEDRDMGRGEVDYLSGVEVQFWKDLIEKYLKPLDADSKKEALMAQGLKELRNKAVFFFAMFNALFVLIVFMLTLHKDVLHIDWPFGAKVEIYISEDDEQAIVGVEYLHLEPIGIVLVFFFFAIILIQFVAMLFHRFGTISHILASTDLSCCAKKEDVLSDEALIEKNAVAIVKQMQKLRGIDGEYESESNSSNRLAHRRTIHMLEKNRNKKRAIGTLDVAFKKRFFALSGGGAEPEGGKPSQTPILGHKLPMRRETLKALENCRDNVITERKQSKMQTLGANNPYNNTKDKHRPSTKLTGDTVGAIFSNGGVDNLGYDANATVNNTSSATDDDTSSTPRNSNKLRSSISWKDRGANAGLGGGIVSSDQNSTSAASKM
ncbi:chitin synthase chs-2 [Lepeophtheirus salmonis]|uniref:chitin synthase chs-2 n=1 Tax=Lepeophtheirus salmonis TaxID=72036 RepID=UPI001AE451CC|nr:chitin synthase chs-2-like [Lepeophtheirus salmonis]